MYDIEKKFVFQKKEPWKILEHFQLSNYLNCHEFLKMGNISDKIK